MILNISIEEAKLIRQALDELVRESTWDEADEYALIIEKLDKGIEFATLMKEYYDSETQED